MKKIFYFALVLPMLLLSCSKDPEADFFIEIDKAKIGQEIFFHNTSQNAETFEWDFGDGYISTDKHPVYKYSLTGTYDVTLTAFSKKGEQDKAIMTINVVEPSLLVIEVLEWPLLESSEIKSVRNASVILYPSLSDWDNQTDALIEGFTDDEGIVVFAELNPPGDQNNEKRCYVDVWHDFYDNYLLREDDPGFITTQVLLPEKIQWFVAWVDYVEHTKGSGRGERTMVIKKLERKVAGKTYPGIYKGPKDYEYLLNKSVKKK